jgi:hypothetical protein
MIYDICIIGAGQSGLVTCKTFSEKTQSILVLEKDASNGMFSFIKEKNLFYWSTSRFMSGFSDFPMNKNIPVWFTIQQYVDYLNSYKKHFDLEKYIQYNSFVEQCRQNKNQEWVVTYNTNQQIICKKLIVCTGLNQTPKYPEIIKNFTGEIIHTKQIYTDMNEKDWKQKFSNKKILLLGGGESAFDIGHLLTKYTNQLYYSSKNYIEWFYTGAETPTNVERAKKIKNKCFQVLDFEKGNYPTDTMLIYPEYSLPEPMSNFWHNYGRRMLKPNRDCGNCVHNHQKLCSINKTPENLFKKYVVKRTDFVLDMFENKVKVIFYPKKIENQTIYTKKEIIPNVDIIVCASGFKKLFPFLEPKVYQDDFIKKMIPYNTSNIAFIGFARPTMGSIATIAEMQSWWVQDYFNHTLKYKIRKPIFRNIDPLNLSNDNIDTLVIGCYYLKDLAKDMNIEPNMFRLFFTDFKLFETIYTNSCNILIYRISGQRSFPKARKIIIDTFPKFKDRDTTSKLYILIHFLYHILFILFCFAISYLLYFIIYRTALVTSHKKTSIWVFFIISFTLIAIFYTFFT